MRAQGRREHAEQAGRAAARDGAGGWVLVVQRGDAELRHDVHLRLRERAAGEVREPGDGRERLGGRRGLVRGHPPDEGPQAGHEVLGQQPVGRQLEEHAVHREETAGEARGKVQGRFREGSVHREETAGEARAGYGGLGTVVGGAKQGRDQRVERVRRERRAGGVRRQHVARQVACCPHKLLRNERVRLGHERVELRRDELEARQQRRAVHYRRVAHEPAPLTPGRWAQGWRPLEQPRHRAADLRVYETIQPGTALVQCRFVVVLVQLHQGW